MRYLTIVRHAKAEKAVAEQRDKDRALNERGRRQCEQLRGWASDETELGRFGPTTALVSAAARTKETFTRAFEGTPFVAEHVESELIYNGLRDVSAEDVLIDLAAIDPVTTSLLVVGHNPTVLYVLASSCETYRVRCVRATRSREPLSLRSPRTSRSAWGPTNSWLTTFPIRASAAGQRLPARRRHTAPPPPRHRRVGEAPTAPSTQDAYPTCQWGARVQWPRHSR